MNKEIDSIFVDVRNSFRLLCKYQKRVLHIVDYIREQTPYTSMWGSKEWYSNEITDKRNSPEPNYAKLNVRKDMWGWDFLYGYIFEYYFGVEEIDNKTVEMSVFQVSDDGYFVSSESKKTMTNISAFAPSEESHSYFVLNITVCEHKQPIVWLYDPAEPNIKIQKDFLTNFLSSPIKERIIKADNGNFSLIKKYEMQRFTSQQTADEVIKDFGQLVYKETGTKVFKKQFYI